MINKVASGKQAPTPSPLMFRGCPYFGIVDDADTRLMFPMEGAVCHRAQPVGEVQLSYQQTTCLTAEHQSCEVFLRQQRAPLPPGITGWEVRGPRSRRVFLGMVVILIFTAVGILAGLWWVNDSGDLEALIPAGEPQGILVAVTHTATATRPAHTATAAPTATYTPSSTPEPTAVPTLTPVPTETLTPSLPPTFTPVRPANTPTATAVRPQTSITVNVERLNVRQGPGVTYPSLGLVEFGAVYDVVGRVSDSSWLQICCVEGAASWVLAETVLVQGILDEVPVIRDIPPPPEPAP